MPFRRRTPPHLPSRVYRASSSSSSPSSLSSSPQTRTPPRGVPVFYLASMGYSLEERKRVFLATRDIFAGQNALIRKQKKVREMILKNENELREILADMGESTVVGVAKGLLEMQMFEMERKARIMFPDLFPREGQENEELRVADYNDEADEVESDGVPIKSEDGAHPVANGDAGTSSNGHSHSKASTPLYPVYFPYLTQHTVLTNAQTTLEDTCFEFVSTHLPSLLTSDKHNYDCGVALELSKWTQMIIEHQSEFPANGAKLAGQELADVLCAAGKLRHTTVHRVHLTGRGIMDLLATAVKVCEALGNEMMAKKMGRLRSEVEKNVQILEEAKAALEDRVRAKTERYRRKREELDRKEKEYFEWVARKDKENKMLVGSALADSVRAMFLGEINCAGDDKGKDNGDCSAPVVNMGGNSDDVEIEPESQPEYML